MTDQERLKRLEQQCSFLENQVKAMKQFLGELTIKALGDFPETESFLKSLQRYEAEHLAHAPNAVDANKA